MTVPYNPRWLTPDPPGQLSNKRGSNTGADALPLKSRYMISRGSADPAGQVQFTADRIGSAAGGALPTPQATWKSGWLGAPTTNALPTALRQTGVAEINNRVYVTGGIDTGGTIYSTVWSAPLNGGSVGAWRQERPMSYYWTAGATSSTLYARYGHGCCIGTFGASGGSGSAGLGMGGTSWLICVGGSGPQGLGSGACIAATINPDGTLGPWQTLFLLNPPLAFCSLAAWPNQYATSGLVLTGGAINNSWNTVATNFYAVAIRNAPANSSSWDVPNGWFVRLPDFTAGLAGHVTICDWANANLMLLRGTSGTVSQTGGYYLKFNIDTINWALQVTGSWVPMTGGAAIQNDAGVVYFSAPYNGANTGSPVSYVYVIGGTSGNALPPPIANAVTTITLGTITWDTSSNPSVVWSTSAHPLPAALSGIRAAIASHPGTGSLQAAGNGPFPDANVARVSTFGGGSGTAPPLSFSTVQSNSIAPSGAGDLTGSWLSGVGAGLASGDLGTGGSVAASSDPTAPAGSQDVTINYGAVTAATSALADGDLVQLGVQYTDRLSGDPSPLSSSILRVGQPPSVSNVAVATTATGQPLVSWAFNGGTGGAIQASWRCVITVTAGGAVMFDSGVILGQANQVQAKIAPVLANVSHTATVTVTSSDSPVSGATATATNTLVWTPTTAAAPGVPTGFAVTPDAANFWDLATWTNGASTTSNRIYHRRNLTSTWTLLLEYTAGSGAQSIKLMDKIPLGVGLDFAISAMGGAAASESALSSVVSNVVLPAPLASPSGYLHLAGQAPTGAVGAYVNAQVQPTLSANYASKVLTGFNASRATVRQGPLDYRKLDVELLTTTLANQKGLQTLVDALLAGGVAYWRGRNGGEMFPVALDNPQEIVTLYPSYRDFKLHLVEVADLYAPYVSLGSAVGIPTLVYGSIPPLDISERVA